MLKMRILSATIVAAIIGFVIHVLYGQGFAMEYVISAAQKGRLNEVIQQPYPVWIVSMAAITALIPAFGKVLLYMLIQDRIRATSNVVRGLLFGVVLLIIDDALLRMPIMSMVIGNPFDVVFVQSFEGWVIPIVTDLIVAHILPYQVGALNKRSGDSVII
jgi:hypothetical protein